MLRPIVETATRARRVDASPKSTKTISPKKSRSSCTARRTGAVVGSATSISPPTSASTGSCVCSPASGEE